MIGRLCEIVLSVFRARNPVDLLPGTLELAAGVERQGRAHLGKRRMKVTALSESFDTSLGRLCIMESRVNKRLSEPPSMYFKTISQNESVTPRSRKRKAN